MEIKDNRKTRDSFLLIDSTVTLKNNDSLAKEYSKIITFDLESHRLLQKNLVKHYVSDEFLDDNDEKKIDFECIKFSQWYLNEAYDKQLCYEGVNFGSLLSSEFNNFLISFLRNFLSFKKIIDNFPNITLVCVPHIHKILNKLTDNLEILCEDDFYYNTKKEKLQYKITNSISIDISEDNFKKLKNISEIITKILVKKDGNRIENGTIALIEFDPIKYETIFNASRNSQSKILLYNRRRPFAYNRKSLRILQQSHVIPYISSQRVLRKYELNGKEKAEEIRKKLSRFFVEKEDQLDNFFKFSNKKFWRLLKSYVVELFNEKILDIIIEIENSKSFISEKKPSAIVVLSENGITEQILLKLARKYSIKTVLLQHGSILDGNDAIDYNRSQGIFPIQSDKFFAWNYSSANCILKSNCSEQKIKVIGSPNIDRIFLKKNISKKNTKKVLLLATGPRNQQSVGYSIEKWEKYEENIKKICKIVTEEKMELIIKQHPDLGEHNLSEQFFQEFPNIKVIKHGEILDLLLESQYVISMGFSSTILEAQILDKPVISLSVDHDVYETPKNVLDSCLVSDIENFEENFVQLIKNSEFCEKIIKNSNKQLESDFTNIGNSAENILREINKND
tara:strand:+ start:2354 stop:4219 length:1866 start_codon:yes stop_codon:yes gene_type:complete